MSQTPDSFRPTVVGRYAIGEQIAAGGMARVHLGLVLGEAGFSRAVAIKRLLPSYTGDPELVAMLVDEARLAARIQHANVVAMLDVVKGEGEIFLVMEYVHGESLSRLFRAATANGERIPLAIASAVVLDALHGLHAAHDATDETGAPIFVVHRDVSPHNILIGADGVSKVLDFGIAKALGRSQVTREGQVKGKLGYLAPEQLSQEADRRTDLYAVGVCLWEALTMRRLFASDSEQAALARILAAKIEPPSTHAEGITPDVDAIVLRALARDPAMRFGDALEMANALERALPPASAAEVSTWTKRLAKGALDKRAEILAALETGRKSAGSTASASRDPSAETKRFVSLLDPVEARAGTLTVVDPEPPIMDAPAARPVAVEPRRARWLTWAAIATMLVAIALVAWPRSNANTSPPIASPALSSSSAPISPPPIASPPASAVSIEIDDGVQPSKRRVAPRASSAPKKPTGVDCTVPFTVDADGIRHYKKECVTHP